MKFYSLDHLADGTVAGFVPAGSFRIRREFAVWIAYLAEFDRRRLFVPQGYSSLYDYCLSKLELSEDEAGKYIRVARAARDFPVIFEALADRRLHLTGVVLLAPHLTPENANELLAAAFHRTRAGIERLIAECFPKPDLPTLVRVIDPVDGATSLAPDFAEALRDLPAPGRVKLSDIEPAADPDGDLGGLLVASVDGTALDLPAPGRVNCHDSVARVTPISPQRFALQTTIEQATHDKLRYAQELLGAAIPSGDVAQVLDRALDALISQLEKRRIGAGSRRRTGRPKQDSRYIPAEVRDAVWHRDAGRCTFTSDTGHRCEARKFLEFDHVEPVARGGQSTIENIRLLCRAHNQLEAEREFGAEFMRRKREAAPGDQAKATDRAAVEQARTEAAERARAAAEQVRAAAEAHAAAERAKAEVLPWLRQLGFRADEARRAAALAASDPSAPLETRVRLAVRQLAPPGTARVEPVGARC